ncbi:hypothetical protein PanWU01x14_068670 [Parasponia andersonii]|uniref:LRR domain containing protein n=1 Tax=Parasponia andersonii TaxID=3476 RepID=A0A2P5DFF5_PARAD|nr:hypothetical protein PanWU01x14_068670 [Parasponia andersonii]
MVNLSMKVPNLLKANVILISSATTYNDLSWYIDLLNFLSNFDCSPNLCLSALSKQALIFPNVLKKACRAPLPTLNLLKVKTRGLLLGNCHLMKSLLWATPSVETLSIVE